MSMQLTPLPPITLKHLVAVNDQSTSRTPGCHVTDIVRAILVKLDPGRYARDYGDASDNWQQAGFIWEELLSKVLASQVDTSAARFRPGELTVDGVIGSPDALAVDGDGGLVVEEYKCTWKSSRGFDLYDKRFLWWLLQLQAYCYMVRTRFARLYVLHINGNYEAKIPETSGYLLTFTQGELDEQWQSFLNTARAEKLL